MEKLTVFTEDFDGKKGTIKTETASWKTIEGVPAGRYAFAGLHFDPRFGRRIEFTMDTNEPFWAEIEYRGGHTDHFLVTRACTDCQNRGGIWLEQDMDDTGSRTFIPFQNVCTIQIHP